MTRGNNEREANGVRGHGSEGVAASFCGKAGGAALPLSRRQFAQALTGGLAAMAVGGLGLFGCAPSKAEATEAREVRDYDVVVLGGGGAGVTAAGWSATAGAKTVLLEKMAWLAGSSSLALGGFYGAGTTVQKAAGIEDDPASLLEYFLSCGGDKLDYDMQEFCAYHFGETIDWLANDLQVDFQEEVLLKGKDTIPRQAKCRTNGMDALNPVTAFAQKAGAEFHFGMAAERLVVDDAGAVTGVIARNGAGELVQYRAKSVIIATGGFCRNEEMIDKYCPDYSGVYTEVGVGCTGEGLQMGLDIGADYVGHGGTNGILACPVEAGQSKLISNKALWIDSKGERFANEAGQTHDISTTKSSLRCTIRPWWTRSTTICARSSTSGSIRGCSRKGRPWPRRPTRWASTARERRRRSTRTTSWLPRARTRSSARRPRASFRSCKRRTTC